MPREAKLGLVLGVGLVLVVAVIFFRKDAALARSAQDPSAVAARPPGALPVARGGRRHVVKDGDTLFGLANHYYHDSTRFVELFRANHAVLKTPEKLPAGAVLVIPELAAEGR
ncbi:MAG: LysM peptidoglycan-binding domain-containing protein [Gemmataceae bacterium]|nr:LysM peptidoglycan-binding domain-containing protein [Gemmataceae bacterium]